MVPRLDKCWDAYVTESKSCFIFKLFFFFFVNVTFFDLASGRVCAAVSKCFIWKGEIMQGQHVNHPF